MILLLLISLGLQVSNGQDWNYNALWKAYQIKYGKSYSLAAEPTRRAIWESNVRKVALHNLEADLGLHSYRMGVNQFTDLTTAERAAYRKCFSKKNSTSEGNVKTFYENGYSVLPSDVDWRKDGYVTEVKDQGMCGSCWAFSSTGALEGQQKAKSGQLVDLSEQNLVDCSTKEGNDGCDGGWMDNAFQYVIDNHGIDKEEIYKYRARDGRCKFRRDGIGANCTSYFRIKNRNETSLQVAVAHRGPVSVAIDATDTFMHYKNGILEDRTCSSTELNHAVLIVGYGTQDNRDYWIVKNSWGTDWGMNGYVLMSRNSHNQCGIASHAVFPVM